MDRKLTGLGEMKKHQTECKRVWIAYEKLKIDYAEARSSTLKEVLEIIDAKINSFKNAKIQGESIAHELDATIVKQTMLSLDIAIQHTEELKSKITALDTITEITTYHGKHPRVTKGK